METIDLKHDENEQRGDHELLLAAQERLERKRRDHKTNNRESTSTRQPRPSENQDCQESQVRQDLEESPIGDLSPSAATKETSYEELFFSGDYAAIPPDKFLRLAWAESSHKNWQDDGVSETWEFCRYLLAHPDFAELTPAGLVKKLRRLTDLEDDLLETIFVEIKRVQYAKGAGPLEWAVGMAEQYPVTDPEEAGLERYDRFLSIAGWLQIQRGDKAIYLPVEKLSKILNVTPRTVSNWRIMAKQQEVLKEVAPYEFRKRATEFRFATERFAVFRERKYL